MLYLFNSSLNKSSHNVVLILALLFTVPTLSQDTIPRAVQAEAKKRIPRKSDTLVLKNKDKIVGEIKDMNNGILTIETEYSDDDFTLKWVDVVSISSPHYFLILLTEGDRINSNISMSTEDPKKIILTDGTLPLTVSIQEIVYIKTIRRSFISRLNASISVGFNITKSNSLRQLTIRSTLGYTADKWIYSAGFNSVRSDQDDAETTSRMDANLSVNYFLEKNWFAEVSTKLLSNDEQKLKLRTEVKAGAGNYLVRNNVMYFGVAGGLGWNNEQFTDDEQTNRNSLEGYLGAKVNLFDIKNIDLLSSIVAYPSITEKNRIRYDYNIDLKYDLPFEFFIKVGFTYNYDSKPVEGASKSDYVFQSTFGWEL